MRITTVIGVFGTLVSLGDESKKKRNLELGLGDIDAIEKTIKFGVAEGGLEFGIGGSFFGKEFFGVIAGREFINRGNVMDLAIGVAVGGAFTAIVKSLVDDMIMPITSLATSLSCLRFMRLMSRTIMKIVKAIMRKLTTFWRKLP